MIPSNFKIYGDLKNPIHAKNINYVLSEIYSTYNNPYIIAIDACLGDLLNVGTVSLDEKPIYPGAAFNKNLPPIGDLSITGTVNIRSKFQLSTLQNTRLFTVMTLADTISKGIYNFTLKASTEKTLNQYRN